MSGFPTHVAESSQRLSPPPMPLTKSALDAHDLRAGSRLTIPPAPVSATSIFLTPMDHLRNTPQLPETLKTMVLSNINPTLTLNQSQAHAVGYTAGTPTKPGRYYTFPAPAIQRLQTLRATPEVPLPNRPGLKGSRSSRNPISEGSSTSGSSKEGSILPSSVPASTVATSSLGGHVRLKRNVHPHYSWIPGSPSLPIFDPDYPNGAPACISPRLRLTKKIGESSPVSHSKDDFSTIMSPNSRTNGHAVIEAVDAADAPPLPESPARRTSTAQPDGADVTQPGNPRSPPALTVFYPSSGEQPYIVDLMLRKPSEMRESHGRVGIVDDVFGHITSVRPDGTHPNGVIPWAEMPGHIASAKKDASRRAIEVLELDERLKKRREAREREVERPTDHMESKWIQLDPLWTCAIVGEEELVREAKEELLQPESRARAESGGTFMTALSHQEPEKETRPPSPRNG